MNLSAEHLITVAVIAAVTTLLVVAARLRPGRWIDTAAIALGLVILVNEASYYIWIGLRGQFDVSWALPVQLCDVASVITALALWFRSQLLVELTYFWGIAGTANGLLTPDISDHWPSYPYIQYFVQHGGIPCAALFLVVGLRIAPSTWAVARVYALTFVLLLADAFVNLLTNGDYMYLRRPPGVSNLLDLMGPWPWYIVGAAILALFLFVVLDAPFKIAALARARSRTSPYPPPA
jgi:hypothetical integral membrane protein (TIGR02206 family)